MPVPDSEAYLRGAWESRWAPDSCTPHSIGPVIPLRSIPEGCGRTTPSTAAESPIGVSFCDSNSAGPTGSRTPDAILEAMIPLTDAGALTRARFKGNVADLADNAGWTTGRGRATPESVHMKEAGRGVYKNRG